MELSLTLVLEISQPGLNSLMVADQEEFQCASVLTEQQTQFQSSAALVNIFPQTPDGNAGVNMWTTKGSRDDPKGRLDAPDVRVAQIFQPRVEAGIEDDGGTSHALVFP